MPQRVRQSGLRSWPTVLRQSLRLRLWLVLVTLGVLAAILLDHAIGWLPDVINQREGPRTNPITFLALLCSAFALLQQRPLRTSSPVESGLWLCVLGLCLLAPVSEGVGTSISGGNGLGIFGWNSALSLVFLALSNLLRHRQATLASALTFLALFFPLVAITGYLMNVPAYFGHMALTTVIAAIPLSLASLLGFFRRPLVAALLRGGPAGRLIRRQLLLSSAIFLCEPLILRPRAKEIAEIYPLFHTLEMLTLLGLGLYFASRLVGLLDKERLVRTRVTRSLEIDPLTGLVTRRVAADRFLRWDSHYPLGLILLDLDHFKSINDRYGHDCGDLVLRDVAWRMKGALKVTDTLVRWGGEEFLAMVRVEPGRELHDVAEGLRRSLAGMSIPGLEDRRVTASLGVVQVDPERARDLSACVALADAALYEAKAMGRNRVIRAVHVSETWAEYQRDDEREDQTA